MTRQGVFPACGVYGFQGRLQMGLFGDDYQGQHPSLGGLPSLYVELVDLPGDGGGSGVIQSDDHGILQWYPSRASI